MQVKAGIDIVYLPRFRKTIRRAGSAFLQRVFLPQELEKRQIPHLAGIFAAKEAVIKALGLPRGAWLDIKITNLSSGAPKIKIENCKLGIVNSDLSISHDGNYVIAQFIALLK